MRFQRVKLSLLTLVLAAAGGCNEYHLHYEAHPQPDNAHLYADYVVLEKNIGILIDTNGKRLEAIYVKRADGTLVQPIGISYPAFGKSVAVGPGIGIGPVGVGVGVPVGPDEAKGVTTATFNKETIGPLPWEVHVKVNGVKETTIPGVGGPATAK